MSLIDPILNLRTVLYTALSGNVTLSGDTIEVYDRVPNTQTTDFIHFDEFRITNVDNHQHYIYEVEAEIEVVTFFQNIEGGKKRAEQIANILLPLITSKTGVLSLGAGWNLVLSKYLRSNYIDEELEFNYVVRKFIVIQFVIQQTA